MRPVSLKVRGFTAFREQVEIDFTDADLFVLSGPTGSGKSSVIDAMCFALYGAIPRLPKSDGLAPIVSVGVNEARVQLTFEADGRTWVVTRLIARTSSGAGQKDVRLEGGGEVLEGVRPVDARIEEVVGLGFDHFTRCVVLPQGRFAAFLEDKPRDRQDLLEQLLDLGVFERMRSFAAARAKHIESDERAVSAQLHEVTVDQAQIDVAMTRLEQLDAFLAASAEVRARLELLSPQLVAASAEVAASDGRLRALRAIALPEGVDQLAEDVAAASAAVLDATKVAATAEEALEEVRARRAELGEISAIDSALAALATVADLRERVAKGETFVAEATEQQRTAAEAAKASKRALLDAQRELRVLEREHAAHALRETLQAGDDCPVCLRPIDELPVDHAPAALSEAKTEVAEAEAAHARDVATEREVDGRLASHVSALAERRAQLVAAESDAEGLDATDVLTKRRAEAERLEGSVKEAEAKLVAARDGVTAAERTRAQVAEREAAVASGFDRVRDTVAGMEPPVPERSDVVADWRALVSWAAVRAESETEQRVTASGTASDLEAEVEKVQDELQEAAVAIGIEADGDPRETAVAARASLEAGIGQMRDELARAERHRAKLAELAPERLRYATTASLLRSNRFPQWVVTEALEDLVAYANDTLSTLSGSTYSLRYEDAEFMVVDHRNADTKRSVRTLSGGETFLVSLALALALAERVAASAGASTSRLGSMFLDEGFGTLDAETLDTVASVVTELGSGDRMVGLVTHVRELAEQIPTRFEVNKRPGGATVERVDT